MGTDIHWMAERLDRHGQWHAVMSKPRAYQIADGPELYGLNRDQARRAMALGYRDYERFAILSCLHDPFPGQDDKLANDQMPFPISDAALEMFEEGTDLHSMGHFTLGEVRRYVGEANGNIFPCDEALNAGRELLRDVEALAADAMLLGEILVGPPYGENFGRHYPQMDVSNHARLARLEQAKMLLPIDDDTLRFLIAYDN